VSPAVRRIFLLFVLAGGATGCASAANPGNHDLAGDNTSVCPLHPTQCSGKCCGNQCTEIMLDVRNCGDCGMQCPPGLICAGGKCGCPPSGTQCGTGQTCCGMNGCKSLDSDINNCGACANICGVGNGQTCSGGKCLCGGVACPAPQKCCNGACMDTCAVTGPDMAMGMAGGQCTCASMCPLSKFCVQNECCFEDLILMTSGKCVDMTLCSPTMYP
jgi:hypothetical protein